MVIKADKETLTKPFNIIFKKSGKKETTKPGDAVAVPTSDNNDKSLFAAEDAAVAAGAMPQLNFANSNVVQGSRIQVSPTKIKTPSLNNSSSSGSNSQASGVVDLAGGGSVSVILQQGPDGQLTLIQQPTSISSPGGSIVTAGSSNNTPASNNSSPLQTTNTLTSLPFFNLTTSMQLTKPLGSKICRWVQVCFYNFCV